MSLFNFGKKKVVEKVVEEPIVYNGPNKAKAKNALHSTGDVHDFLKEKYNAQLDFVWIGGMKRARLHLPDGSVVVGEGETHDEATAALVEKLGGL